MNNKVARIGLVLLVLLIPATAHAHRAWLLPSATVLSGAEAWITVDAASGNDLFFFDHHPLQLDGLKIVGPGEVEIDAQNKSTGRFRSTFDLEMKKPGTYRLTINGDGLFASYEHNGERKRWRGRPENFAKEIPKDAKDLHVVQSQRRLETYATLGSPDQSVLKSTKKGLELDPITHPNDLFAGEEARFKLLLDGEPAPNVEVSIIRGGIRYRDDPGEMKLTTSEDGTFSVVWPDPGMYWLEASLTDDKTTFEPASERRLTYALTLEVLPE